MRITSLGPVCAALAALATATRADNSLHIEPRAGLEVACIGLEADASVPVHAGDWGSTPAHVRLSEDLWNFAPFVGVEISLDLAGTARLFAGADARLNSAATGAGDGYRTEPCATEQFPDHPWPAYGYLQVQEVPWYSLVPFAGVGVTVGGFEIGVAFSLYPLEYGLESGWDRYGAFEPFESHDAGLDVQRWSLIIGRTGSDDEPPWELALFNESAEADDAFALEHTAWGASLAVRF